EGRQARREEDGEEGGEASRREEDGEEGRQAPWCEEDGEEGGQAPWREEDGEEGRQAPWREEDGEEGGQAPWREEDGEEGRQAPWREEDGEARFAPSLIPSTRFRPDDAHGVSAAVRPEAWTSSSPSPPRRRQARCRGGACDGRPCAGVLLAVPVVPTDYLHASLMTHCVAMRRVAICCPALLMRAATTRSRRVPVRAGHVKAA